MDAQNVLHDWFLSVQRSFPWREERTPYKVWVSEIMLQQTRAEVVVPYFLRWMERFPSVQSLAEASLEAVIKTWEGLGYYSRARNLHKAAIEIVKKWDGKLPSSLEALSSLPGIGTYTAGAILSFAFLQRAAAVDGNVVRVMSRYFAVQENVDQKKVRNNLEKKTLAFLDFASPWMTSEALIELGALICRPKPDCNQCPLQDSCLANRQKIAETLPLKNGRQLVTVLKRHVAVIQADHAVLVRKMEKGKLMADLYEFPYFEGEECTSHSMIEWVKRSFGLIVESTGALTQVSHTFTRYKAVLYPLCFVAKQKKSVPDWEWVKLQDLRSLPFSSGHRRLAEQLKEKGL